MDAVPSPQPGSSAEAQPSSRPVRVTLIGRDGCHLCDAAREVVARVTADLGVVWEELSVDSDPALLEEWSDQVPVTLVDGRQHDYWRVDEARLRAALGG
jgi:hypothetical protein